MNPLRACALVLVLAVLALPCLGERAAAAGDGEPMIAHCVYFTLKDSTPDNRAKLVKACKKYLSNHPGTVYFAAGPRAEEFKRPVNDQEFDVSLVIVFKNKAAHDKYQDSETHQQFIRENRETWAKVRVFDSEAEHGKAAGAER